MKPTMVVTIPESESIGLELGDPLGVRWPDGWIMGEFLITKITRPGDGAVIIEAACGMERR